VVESATNPLKRNTNSKSKIGELMHSTDESDVRDKRSAMLKRILNKQEKQIISLRFGIPDGNNMTLEQIGNNLGLTRERVRQIEKKALDKLRGHPSLKFLKDYLDE
jgi:RNA polymerase primary sigma factor